MALAFALALAACLNSDMPAALGYAQVRGTVFGASGTPMPGGVVQIVCPPWLDVGTPVNDNGTFVFFLTYAPEDTVAVPPPPSRSVPGFPGDIFTMSCSASTTITRGRDPTVAGPFDVDFSLFETSGGTSIELREEPDA